MSHRTTLKTEITEKGLAIQALKSAGWGYAEEGSHLRITSGPMNRATINLSTGEVSGDTDWHGRGQLGALRKHYSEAKIRADVLKRGATIDSREVLKSGEIRLVVSANFG